MLEKIIGAVEKTNLYVIIMEKKPLKLCLKLKKNNKKKQKNNMLCRCVYQSLFLDIAGVFIQHIHSLERDEIKMLDNNIKANGGGGGGRINC